MNISWLEEGTCEEQLNNSQDNDGVIVNWQQIIWGILIVFINILDKCKLGVCAVITVNGEAIQRCDIFMFDCICPLKNIFLWN